MAENGKIRFPKSGNPSIPPPTGSFYTWLSTEGFFKKMDDQGNVTNLSAQSLIDLPEIELSDVSDGQILIYDQNSDRWVNQDFPIIENGDGATSSLVNNDGKTVAQATSTGIDLIASNDVTMLKTDVGGVEIHDHLRLKASQFGNAMEIGEGNTKYVYFKFDQLKNLNFLANYNKGFIFRVDDSIDGVLTDAFSPFSIFKDSVVSNAHHNFMDSVSVKGQISCDTDGMSASLLSTTSVNGVDVELHKIVPSLNQVRYATRNNAQHIFSIDNADGNDMHDITVMGLNGTVHSTKHQFNAGVSLFGNKLESLADPTSSDDAATKNYVDTEIASVKQPETLYDNIGEERVTATVEGVDLYGTTTFRKPESGYFLEHIPDSGADAGKRLFAMIDYGGPTKFQSRWGRGFQFQVADSSDANLTQLFNISYDMIESKKLHKFAGSVEGNSAKFSYIEVENFLGGTFLKLGDGSVDNFVFSTRSNQNKIVQPSDYVCNFMFDDNGSATNSLTIAKGLCIADTDFQFNSYTSFKQEMDLSNKRIKNVGTPTQPSDAVTKTYVDGAVSSAAAAIENDIDSITGEGAIEFDVDELKFKLNLLQDEEGVYQSLSVSGANISVFNGDYISPEWEGALIPFDLDLLGSSVRFKPNQGDALMYVNGDKVIGYCDEISHWIFIKLSSVYDFSNSSMGETSIPIDFWAQLGTGTTTLASGRIVPLDALVTFTGAPRDGSYITNTPAGFGVKAVKQLSQAEEGVLLDSKTIKQELDKKVEEDNVYDFVRMKSSDGSVWKLSVNDSGGVVVSPD